MLKATTESGEGAKAASGVADGGGVGLGYAADGGALRLASPQQLPSVTLNPRHNAMGGGLREASLGSLCTVEGLASSKDAPRVKRSAWTTLKPRVATDAFLVSICRR